MANTVERTDTDVAYRDGVHYVCSTLISACTYENVRLNLLWRPEGLDQWLARLVREAGCAGLYADASVLTALRGALDAHARLGTDPGAFRAEVTRLLVTFPDEWVVQLVRCAPGGGR